MRNTTMMKSWVRKVRGMNVINSKKPTFDDWTLIGLLCSEIIGYFLIILHICGVI